MKKDGSLNWFEKSFVKSFDHPILSSAFWGAVTLAGGLSVAAIVNHSLSEESPQNPQKLWFEVHDCLEDKRPMSSEGPR